MNTTSNSPKLSHIVVNVNRNVTKQPIWAFCTNIKSEEPLIRFTYLSYDNQNPDNAIEVLCNLFNTLPENRDSLFIITDSPVVTEYTKRTGVATAALYTGQNRDENFPDVLYCIEDIEFMTYSRIERMWRRHFGIPWIIAVTDRLVIREHTMDDIDDLYDIYADPEASRYMEDLYEDRNEEADYLRKYIDNQYRFFEYGIWAVTLKEDGRLIGRAGISQRDGYDIPEIGYIIGSGYRRCGYAKEAVSAVINYGRKELGLTGYIAFSKEKNRASAELLKSLGFTLAGTADITGGIHAMYSLTKQQ